MTEAESQNISALAQIEAGLAGGLTGNRASDAAQGAIAGKNAVENNYLTQMQAKEFKGAYGHFCITEECKIKRTGLIEKYRL